MDSIKYTDTQLFDAIDHTSSVYPFSYIYSLLTQLKMCQNIRFLTYQDLPFPKNFKINSEDSLKEFYRLEWLAYNKINKDKKYIDIVLMHDCDSEPLQTSLIVNVEAKLGIKSTTSLFAKWKIDNSLVSYPINFHLLVEAQSKGIVFSYHCNAYENSNYNKNFVGKLFDEDVKYLRKKGLRINFYSAHGGKPCSDGINNNSFFYPIITKSKLISTHNKYAPSGNRFSDGGLHRRLLKADSSTDLRDFLIQKIDVNKRFFILLHPQYYFLGSQLVDSIFLKNSWVNEFFHLHKLNKTDKYWEPVISKINSLA